MKAAYGLKYSRLDGCGQNIIRRIGDRGGRKEEGRGEEGDSVQHLMDGNATFGLEGSTTRDGGRES